MSDQLNTVASDVMSDPSIIPGTRIEVDWTRFVSGQDIILATPSQEFANYSGPDISTRIMRSTGVIPVCFSPFVQVTVYCTSLAWLPRPKWSVRSF